MKIGIMGGTFDPIHNGHLMLARTAYEDFALDEVWFMPNGHPPHKEPNTIESKIADRVRMVELAIKDQKEFRLQDYEARKEQVSFSYETMETFVKQYPEDTFYFIIGADSLFSIESWVHPERLLKCCVILAACRDEMSTKSIMNQKISYLNEKYHSQIALLASPLVNISSHELRFMRKEKQSIRGLVPRAVEEYMIKEGLYEPEDS